MTEFGMPALIEAGAAEENVSLALELGLRFVELNMNYPEYQADHMETPEFRAFARGAGVYFTIHLDENLNVADFNPEVRRAWTGTVRRAIRIAGEIGAPVLNMHMNHGVYITLPDRRVWLYDRDRETYLGYMAAFRDLCDREARGTGVRICLENTDGFTDFELEAIPLLLESPAFGLTWDIGHSRTAGEKDAPFLLDHRERLAHFHVHDATDQKNHLTLGTGGIDLKDRLETAAGNGCRCVLETKTSEALRQSVAWLRDRGYM